MKKRLGLAAVLLALPALPIPIAPPAHAQAETPAAQGYGALVALYNEFRAFVPPPMVKGVPDYSPATMARHYAELQRFEARLAAIDDSKWPVPQRVDYMVVLVEMRGLEFQHRVMQPWKRDPAFYSTTNLGFGPKMHGAIAIPKLPIARDKAEVLAAKLDAVPEALRQARANLTDARGDLARLAIVQKQVEVNVYGELAAQAAKLQPSLVAPAKRAQAAAAEFKAWLEGIEAGLPAYGGVGAENYAWYLKHVLLLPYTPDEIRVIGEREYQRQLAFLKIEEHRNRAIPMPEPVKTRAEFDSKRRQEDEDLLRFLRDGQWVTIPDYVKHDPEEGPYQFPFEKDPSKPGLFDPPQHLHFFFQAEFRDGRPLRAHNLPGHAFDALQAARDTRPVRGQSRLFFVNGLRNEGWAFYLEEFLIQSGMLEDRPKAREIDYILGAKRAARILPELKMQANEWTWQQANASLVSRTPKWMAPGDAVAQFDIELYLRQPGYGIGYYMGKVELEKLLADVAMQEGDRFDIKSFHDRFRAAGSIPISLIRWEMTGKDDEVRALR
ncbi:uncharacterized protein (DUF885 family) [Sphingomonas kyeonggiensis]|uniref:Uncharacterized protein (DUF885 family) n=1 Tax=Sphingomonas kyeonggiensis TaxID=1268553 RepID=A0A7W7K020_9SPHN|nr:DUF885 family protein [Sphingomonas kyeonggiensis]MBB4838552.1 uncharacterized protein (DUF885 family) [Sphingomonas kyeonggiensis]